VLKLLRAAVRQPAGVRPSVESNLHALFDRVVVHSHPVQLTAFLASNQSRDRWKSVLAAIEEPALYLDYVDPGFTLASALAQEIAAFEKAKGVRPQIVLLENHGLIVAAPTADLCLELHERVVAAGVRWSGRGRVNPPREESRPVAPATATMSDAATRLLLRVRGALLRGGAQPVIVALDRSPIAEELVADEAAFESMTQGAFTPDLIVYCRTRPVVFRGADRNAWIAAVTAYREQHGIDPRVVLVQGRGLFHVAPDVAQLEVVSETHRLGQAVALLSGRAGGPRHLGSRETKFIEEWEVEKFRAALVEGGAKPLSGRVVLILTDGGAATPGGAAPFDLAAWSSALVAAGATVATTTSARIPSALHECGGLDFVVDACRELNPAAQLLADLLAIFATQDAKGTIVIAGQTDDRLSALSGPGRLAGVRVRGLPEDQTSPEGLLTLLESAG
jgi:rhamnose utilization protein RhaD (predicted bifunctional aldolase and dehydrogenase)